MKYIKLYETFDRYEFKNYTTDYGDAFGEMYKIKVDFSDIEIEELRKHFPKLRVHTFANERYIGMCNGSYYIYALGDYCYSIASIRNTTVIALCTVDDLEEVVSKLNELIGLNPVHETFDRYNFGEYDEDDQNFDPNIVVNQIVEERVSFSSSENNAIIKLLDVSNCTDYIYGPDIFNINIEHDENNDAIEGAKVFALGDDCFAIAWATLYYGGVEEYHRVAIIDQLDELLDRLKDILQH
jgi:hypothetical protein